MIPASYMYNYNYRFYYGFGYYGFYYGLINTEEMINANPFIKWKHSTSCLLYNPEWVIRQVYSDTHNYRHHTNSRDYHTVLVTPQNPSHIPRHLYYVHTASPDLHHMYTTATQRCVHGHTHTHSTHMYTCHNDHTVQVAACTNVFVHIIM